jgi:ABC-type ATPase with predicted acetyltransferase domain
VADEVFIMLKSIIFSFSYRKDVKIPEILGSKLLDALESKRRQRAEAIVSFQERVAAEREEVKQAVSKSPLVIQAQELLEKLQYKRPDISLRIKDGYFKYTEQVDESQTKKDAKQRIETVYNGAPVQGLWQKLRRLASCSKGGSKIIEHYPLKNVNLYFEQGKTYLVLGGPRSGKSTLLRMIAGILPEDKDHQVDGMVAINRFDTKSKGVVWSNLVGYAWFCASL